MCKGRQICDVFAHFMNGACNYCAGVGVLDTDVTCTCGRPAVLEMNGIHVCTRAECHIAAAKCEKGTP